MHASRVGWDAVISAARRTLEVQRWLLQFVNIYYNDQHYEHSETAKPGDAIASTGAVGSLAPRPNTQPSVERQSTEPQTCARLALDLVGGRVGARIVTLPS